MSFDFISTPAASRRWSGHLDFVFFFLIDLVLLLLIQQRMLILLRTTIAVLFDYIRPCLSQIYIFSSVFKFEVRNAKVARAYMMIILKRQSVVQIWFADFFFREVRCL
jgi:hypothetical protein